MNAYCMCPDCRRTFTVPYELGENPFRLCPACSLARNAGDLDPEPRETVPRGRSMGYVMLLLIGCGLFGLVLWLVLRYAFRP